MKRMINTLKKTCTSHPLLTGCLGRAREEKKERSLATKKKRARSTATATGENVIKIDAGSLRNYGYFGSGKLQIGTLMLTPPLKYFGLTKSSH